MEKINTKVLNQYLKADKNIILSGDDENPYISDVRFRYIDEGSKILCVVHADTVLEPKGIMSISKNGQKIYAPCLDDRLGVYLALEYLHEIGIYADVLITDNEELCQSTAQFFGLGDRYNWIFELDRAGGDYVTYDCGSYDLEYALQTEGFVDGMGSYSDICVIPTDTACFNVGIGYKKAHSKNSFVDTRVLYSQMKKLKSFYDKYKNVKFTKDSYFEFDPDDNFEGEGFSIVDMEQYSQYDLSLYEGGGEF